MEMAKLSNGTEEAMPLVSVITMALGKMLYEGKAVLFYELVMLARDKNHKPFGSAADDLRRMRLVNDDMSMHSSTRNIIRCSVRGDALNMRIVSPLEKENES